MRGFVDPVKRLARVARHAATFAVAEAEQQLGPLVAAFGGVGNGGDLRIGRGRCLGRVRGQHGAKAEAKAEAESHEILAGSVAGLAMEYYRPDRRICRCPSGRRSAKDAAIEAVDAADVSVAGAAQRTERARASRHGQTSQVPSFRRKRCACARWGPNGIASSGARRRKY